jgi:hypothetical protein
MFHYDSSVLFNSKIEGSTQKEIPINLFDFEVSSSYILKLGLFSLTAEAGSLYKDIYSFKPNGPALEIINGYIVEASIGGSLLFSINGKLTKLSATTFFPAVSNFKIIESTRTRLGLEYSHLIFRGKYYMTYALITDLSIYDFTTDQVIKSKQTQQKTALLNSSMNIGFTWPY